MNFLQKFKASNAAQTIVIVAILILIINIGYQVVHPTSIARWTWNIIVCFFIFITLFQIATGDEYEDFDENRIINDCYKIMISGLIGTLFSIFL